MTKNGKWYGKKVSNQSRSGTHGCPAQRIVTPCRPSLLVYLVKSVSLLFNLAATLSRTDGALCQPVSYIVEGENQINMDGSAYSYGGDYRCLPNIIQNPDFPSMNQATTVVSL